MTPKKRENEVLPELLKWLNKTGFIWAWRRSVGVQRIGGRWIRYGQKGQSDIEGVVMIPGGDQWPVAIHLEVEAKAPGNKPTPEQAAWLAAQATAGSVAVWADSVPVLEEKLRQHFRHRGWPWPGA